MVVSNGEKKKANREEPEIEERIGLLKNGEDKNTPPIKTKKTFN